MLTANCGYSFDGIWYYPETEFTYYPTEQINSGTWLGNAIVLNQRTDSLYERCDGSIAQPCSANYTFNLSVYGILTNVTNINVYFSGQTDTAGRTLTMAYWNGTAFTNLTNTLTFSGTGGSIPTAYDEFLSNSIPLSALINKTIKIKLLTGGSVRVFQNWLTLKILSQTGTIQDLKGSSEMNVHNVTDIKSHYHKMDTNSTLYFILREPLERIIGEYKHYSNNLQTIGQVNHLTMTDLKKDNPNNYSATTHTQLGYWLNKGCGENEAKEKATQKQKDVEEKEAKVKNEKSKHEHEKLEKSKKNPEK